jgi:hypothetical protein
MLSLFPELLFLSPFAAFLIRIALAGVFGYSALSRIRSGNALLKVFGVIDTLLAVAFLLGLSTQLAAAIGMVCTAAWLVRPDWNPYPKSTAALALVMCASLLVLGAGPFAFDLPL